MGTLPVYAYSLTDALSAINYHPPNEAARLFKERFPA